MNYTENNILKIINENDNKKKLDLFIDFLENLKNLKYSELSNINKELELKKNEIIYEYFSKCALELGVNMKNIDILNKTKLNEIKICSKKFNNINNQNLIKKLSGILKDKEKHQKIYDFINNIMLLHNEIYSKFNNLRQILSNNVPFNINLDYFDMLYSRNFKYIPNYIIILFQDYIPYYMKNFNKETKNKLEKNINKLLEELKKLKEKFLNNIRSKDFENYIKNVDYGLYGSIIVSINSIEKIKLYHPQSKINSTKSIKTENLSTYNSTPNITPISIKSMKNLFEQKIKQHKI
jgi:hypothetical protein